MEQVTIQISGGGPFGFRLYGGDGDPLLIAKLRKRSKAHDAGLLEGDVLLGINGFSCQRMTHSVAMGMVDSSKELLTLLILRSSAEPRRSCCQFCGVYKPRYKAVRGTADPNAVAAAFQALGGQLKAPSAGHAPQESQGSVPSYAPSFQAQPMAVMNGMEDSGHRSSDSSFRRETQTHREGDSTRQITTETSTEKFGGTTVTKVRRQEVTTFDPHVQQTPMFQVSSTSGKKPGVWSPSGATNKASVVGISAPSGVQVQHNPDQSFTLSFGFGSDQKENISPQQQQPMFKVNKVQTAQPKQGTWQPSHMPPAPTRAPEPEPEPEPMEMEPEPPQQDPSHAWGAENQFNKPKAFHLQRILIEGTGSGSEEFSGPDSPDVDGFSRRKKLFGDSAFYDDPEHKYPTIEEQIKMARRVALSLTAPQNQQARGHRMFVKRAQRADKWSTDNPGGPVETDEDEEEDGLHYNPNPWKAPSHTWKPTGQPTVPSHSLMSDMGVPKPPPLPTNLFSTPTLPVLKYNKDKTNAMSQEEIERMRLFEQKTTHDAVSPQICFSLADDLRNMKGKGGKLFAKRKERSKKWVVEEQEGDQEDKGPDPDFLKKIGAVPMMPGMGLPMGKPAPKKKESTEEGMPVNRLKEMINPPKPKMTPWDAAAQDDGRVDQAFEHLAGYRPYAAHPSGLQENLQKAASQQEKPAPIPTGPGKMPEGVKKIQGWGGAASSSAPSDSFQANSSSPESAPSSPMSHTSSVCMSPLSASFTAGFNDPFAAKPSAESSLRRISGAPATSSRGSFSSETSSQKGGFKPVKFQLTGSGAPQASSSGGGFNSRSTSSNSTPWSASPAPSSGYGGFGGSGSAAGICDL